MLFYHLAYHICHCYHQGSRICHFYRLDSCLLTMHVISFYLHQYLSALFDQEQNQLSQLWQKFFYKFLMVIFEKLRDSTAANAVPDFFRVKWKVEVMWV